MTTPNSCAGSRGQPQMCSILACYDPDGKSGESSTATMSGKFLHWPHVPHLPETRFSHLTTRMIFLEWC